MASTLTTEFAHLQIPLEDVLMATNNFSKKNIIGRGGFGNVYRGKLKNQYGKWLKIAARRLDRRYGQGDVEFWTEVSMLSSLKHKNIVSMIGFSDEKGEKIIINQRYPKGSLSKYLSDTNLTWDQRLKITSGLADALYYMHNLPGESYHIIHRNINSSTILLDEKWEPKLSGFEFSIRHPKDRKTQVFSSEPIGTQGYIDPVTDKTGGVTDKSDIYSLGVVIFEIVCGREAFISNDHDNMFLVPLARSKYYEQRTLQEIIDHDLRNQRDSSTVSGFLSAQAFLCTAEERTHRPEAFSVSCIISLTIKYPNEGGRFFQAIADSQDTTIHKKASFKPTKKNHIPGTFRMSFNDIRLATKNFSRVIGEGGFGSVYIGEVAQKHSYGHNAIVAKKLDRSHGQGQLQFYNELQILYKYKHENVIGLIGYSDETDEKLIVYEHASKGSLDRYLNDVELTWRKRLMICVDIASGLDFLHGGVEGQEVVIHRDIKTPNILLFDDWEAKLGDFGLSLISTIDKETHFTIDRPCGTKGYVDPLYLISGLLTIESDVYSFGVVLFEILCGRATYKIPNLEDQSLLSFIRHNFEEGKQDEIVFRAIKEEIVPKSLTTYIDIIYKCLDDDKGKRPKSKEVLAQLQKALEFQMDGCKNDSSEQTHINWSINYQARIKAAFVLGVCLLRRLSCSCFL